MTLEYSLLEDLLSETQTQAEVEYVFFGRPKNFDFMKKYSPSRIEQYEVWPEKKDGSVNIIRVRKTSKKTVMTLKINEGFDKKNGVVSRKENEFDITEESFQVFKKLCVFGSKKDRFEISTTHGFVFEVDVYYDAHDNLNPWIKIDLEVPSADIPIPKIPIEMHEIITNQPTFRTKSEEETVKRVWNSFMIT